MQRVLVVEDDENQRKSLSVALRLEGFEVSLASSGPDALRVLSEGSGPNVALIDLMMPGVNGLDLARQIRRLYPGVRVVLSSAYHLSASQFERANCGACSFVPKPYRLADLCRALSGAKSDVAAPIAQAAC